MFHSLEFLLIGPKPMYLQHAWETLEAVPCSGSGSTVPSQCPSVRRWLASIAECLSIVTLTFCQDRVLCKPLNPSSPLLSPYRDWQRSMMSIIKASPATTTNKIGSWLHCRRARQTAVDKLRCCRWRGRRTRTAHTGRPPTPTVLFGWLAHSWTVQSRVQVSGLAV